TLAHTIAVADVQVRAVFAPVFQHHSQAPLHRQPIWLTALFLEGRLGTLQHSGHLGKRPLSHPGQSPEHLLRHSFPSLHLHDGPPLTGEEWNHSWDGEGILKMRLCKRSNDIAVGIAMMLFGTGLAFFLGKPYIQPSAPQLPSIDLGGWSDIPQLKAALQINVLFLVGIAVAIALGWMLNNTAWGLKVRVVGES